MEIYLDDLSTGSPYELQKDMKFIKEIDHGAFGNVILAKESKKNIDYAVKVINKSGLGEKLIKQMKEEVLILKKINHNNIVKFYGYSETNNQLLINMEYIKYGTLSNWMKSNHKIKESDASIIIGKVLSAVEYLHNMHICHRDIKPENIMISKENDLTSIKIIDFGLSSQHLNYISNNEYCGTFLYMAPEQIEKKFCYYSIDIWSIGILMYMLLNNGKHPFYQKNDKKSDFIRKIKIGQLKYINKLSYMAKDLLKKLCEPNPMWRYSASMAIKHPWITRDPYGEVPFTFKEILDRNNMKKNAQQIIMSCIFLNYVKKNINKCINSNNNKNNEISYKKKKFKYKDKIFIINNDYIINCRLVEQKRKERNKKLREKCLEVLSTEEDSSEGKKSDNNRSKSTDKFFTAQKKNNNSHDDSNVENTSKIYKSNKKPYIKRKTLSLKVNNFVNANFKKKTVNKIILDDKIDKIFSPKINNYQRKEKMKANTNKINFTSFKNNNIFSTIKNKSMSKFQISKDSLSPEKKDKKIRISSKLISKNLNPALLQELQIQDNLPVLSHNKNKQRNNSITKIHNKIGSGKKYNIIPLVLPFIGKK